MNGTLGKIVPTASTLTPLYTLSAGCLFGEISILAINPNASVATVDIAIATTTTPTPAEYVAKSYPLDGITGFLERNGIIVSPGEIILVKSDKSDTIFRVFGNEKITNT